MRLNRRQRTQVTASVLTASVSLCAVAAAARGEESESASTASDRWTPPENYHYDPHSSFRGLTADGKVENYDVSGHAAVLAGVHDFIRLVPSTPLAHGAIFAREPIQYKEWIAEVAFRVHGPPTHAAGELGEDGKPKRLLKGGRGLAFWYTKNGLPGPATISSDPKVQVSPPPPVQPDTPRDKHDSDVSFFGARTSFDGLGIIFDTAPTSPVWRRSDQLNHPDLVALGSVGASGVVSGILDDASQSWLDPEGQVPKGEDEAAYLGKAIGECEAAFRNAQGLLWARIAHYNSTIRVDLDLSPHTTLAKAGRHYEHNCFTIDGINLPPGSKFGISGLASANTEPDTVDVYAMDVFELKADGQPVDDHQEPVDPRDSAPLEGTSADATESLAHEIFLSQTKMIESIDDLARRIESMSMLVRGGSAGGRPPAPAQTPPASSSSSDSSQGGFSEAKYAALESHLRAISDLVQGVRADGTGSRTVLDEVKQLSERVLGMVDALGRQVESNSAQSGHHFSTLLSRSSDSLNHLTTLLAPPSPSSSGSWLGGSGSLLAPIGWAGVGAVGGVLFAAWREKRRGGGEAWERKYL